MIDDAALAAALLRSTLRMLRQNSKGSKVLHFARRLHTVAPPLNTGTAAGASSGRGRPSPAGRPLSRARRAGYSAQKVNLRLRWWNKFNLNLAKTPTGDARQLDFKASGLVSGVGDRATDNRMQADGTFYVPIAKETAGTFHGTIAGGANYGSVFGARQEAIRSPSPPERARRGAFFFGKDHDRAPSSNPAARHPAGRRHRRAAHR